MTDDLVDPRLGPTLVKDLKKALLEIPAGILALALKFNPAYLDKLAVEARNAEMVGRSIEALESPSAAPNSELVDASQRKDGLRYYSPNAPWHFRAVELLMFPDRRGISLNQDLESFFWVVLYHILRYMRHNRIHIVKTVIAYVFEEERDRTPNACSPGLNKSRTFTNTDHGGLDYGFSIYANEPLNKFTTAMLDHFDQWYRRVYSNDDDIENELQEYDISREEAVNRFPFDNSNLVMRNHDVMLSTLESVLEMETWPTSDKARDLLSDEDNDWIHGWHD